VLADGTAGNRLVTVYTGLDDGFIICAQLMYKAGTASGDYHKQMNRHNLEKLVKEKLLHNFPEKSVAIFDSAPYHSIQMDKHSSKYAMK
jgi:hypothetical protein